MLCSSLEIPWKYLSLALLNVFYFCTLQDSITYNCIVWVIPAPFHSSWSMFEHLFLAFGPIFKGFEPLTGKSRSLGADLWKVYWVFHFCAYSPCFPISQLPWEKSAMNSYCQEFHHNFSTIMDLKHLWRCEPIGTFPPYSALSGFHQNVQSN